MKLRTNSLLTLALFAGSFALTEAATFERTIERNLTLDPNRRVLIEVASADVEVFGSSVEALQLEVHLETDADSETEAQSRFDIVELTTEVVNGDTVIKLPQRSNSRRRFLFWSWNDGVEAEMRLLVPARYGVSVQSASADTQIEGVAGNHRVKTASGDIEVTSCAGDHRLVAISGDIELRASDGRHRLQTISGDIELEDLAGVLDLEAVSGDVDIDAFSGGLFSRTISGDVEVHFRPGLLEPVTIETVSGDVQLRLPVGATGELMLDTVSGAISVGPEAKGTLDEDGRGYRGTLNGGGAQIRVDTTSGNVSVRTAE